MNKRCSGQSWKNDVYGKIIFRKIFKIKVWQNFHNWSLGKLDLAKFSKLEFGKIRFGKIFEIKVWQNFQNWTLAKLDLEKISKLEFGKIFRIGVWEN